MCRSVNTPPSVPAFTGKGQRVSHTSTLTSAVTQMAQVLTPGGSFASSAAATSTTETNISPAKMVTTTYAGFTWII